MILWLASYPKSGNTYLRSFLSTYFFSKDDCYSFDLLKNIGQYPKTSVFSRLGINIKDRHEVAKSHLKVQKKINDSKTLKFLKTHSSFVKMDGYSFTDLDNTLGVIYVVRDPRNVVSSFANHNSKTINDTTKLLMNELATGNEKDDVEVYMGSWAFNFNSWKTYKASNKYFLVKYEDLLNDTKKIFIEVLKFISSVSGSALKIDDKKLEKVIETTDFNYLKNMENKYGFNEAKINDNTGKKVNFFNLGPNNKWQILLNNEIREKIEVNFKNEMKELGYI